jgi:uncharacterized protein YgiM (DUF1202 family)
MAFKIFFKELNESLQGEFQKKIRQAKKGECAGIMKELEAAFKDHKINQNEFDMLTAMTGRKMDKLEEAKEIKSAVLVKNYGDFKKGTKVKVLSFEGSGRYKVEFPDKSTDIIGVSSIAFSVTEAVSQSQVQKVRGILGKATKGGMKGNSEFGTWKFKDGSYIEVDDNKARIDYMGKDGKLITSYTTVNQMKSALYQSGLLESTEGDIELKVGSSCAYKGTKCKVLKALGGNKYEIEYKGKPLNVKMQGMTLVTESEELEEAIEGINNTGIGYVISYSMFMIAQTHIWHLLCKSGQKHVALKNFYDELQDEVDELAERFIAQGGILSDVEANLVARYDDFEIVSAFNSYREMVTSCVESRPEMASIVDGIVDLQEVIDSNLYKFNLN